MKGYREIEVVGKECHYNRCKVKMEDPTNRPQNGDISMLTQKENIRLNNPLDGMVSLIGYPLKYTQGDGTVRPVIGTVNSG